MAKTLYKVQAGAFRQKANAEKMAAKVKAKGIPATVVNSDGLLKVQAGAFRQKANAEKRLAALKKAGWPNAVIITVPGTDPAPIQTGWDKVLAVLNSIMKASNPHQRVIDILKKHGHTLKESSAWCSETVVVAFLESGQENLIGGYAADAPTLKKHAKSLGIWHDGSSGIKAGDIVLYGSGEPNHTEIAIDSEYNISGNYEGTVKKRKRGGRTIHGYIRPKYPGVPAGTRIRIAALAFFDTGDESAQYNYLCLSFAKNV